MCLFINQHIYWSVLYPLWFHNCSKIRVASPEACPRLSTWTHRTAHMCACVRVPGIHSHLRVGHWTGGVNDLISGPPADQTACHPAPPTTNRSALSFFVYGAILRCNQNQCTKIIIMPPPSRGLIEVAKKLPKSYGVMPFRNFSYITELRLDTTK